MAISRVRCSFSLYKTSICCCISTLGPRILILSSSSNWRTIMLCFCNWTFTNEFYYSAVHWESDREHVSSRIFIHLSSSFQNSSSLDIRKKCRFIQAHVDNRIARWKCHSPVTDAEGFFVLSNTVLFEQFSDLSSLMALTTRYECADRQKSHREKRKKRPHFRCAIEKHVHRRAISLIKCLRLNGMLWLNEAF